MQRTVSIILLFLMCLAIPAQTINQKGVTYRYNGKNKRTPIGGVYIKPITAANSVVSDESSGTFTLALDNLKMGSRIGNVRVTKQGMMVFNQQAVDEWSVRKDPLCLILCNADEFQKQKKNLIAIGESQAKKKYDQKLAELKKQNDAQQLKIDEYYNKLDSLEKEYQNALKHMDEYADVFARIDESEADTMAQRAIEMFNRGEIEESLRLFEQGNYIKKLDAALHTKEQAKELRLVADSVETLADKDIKECVNNIKVQIAAYKINNDFQKVGKLLKELADKTNTLDAIWRFAVFCEDQNQLHEALSYHQKGLFIAKKCEYIDSIFVSSFEFGIGGCFHRQRDYDNAELMYKTAINTIHSIVDTNKEAIVMICVHYYIRLANLYSETNQTEKFMGIYNAFIEPLNNICNNAQGVVESELASLYFDMAGNFRRIKEYNKSEDFYKKAIKYTTYTDSLYNGNFKHPKIRANIGLAELYVETCKYKDAEKIYTICLNMLQQEAKINAYEYEPDLATTQMNLALLYSKTGKYSESEELYKASMIIFERLVKRNPAVYEADLARLYANMADMYDDCQQYEESELMYNSSVSIYKRLYSVNPKLYGSSIIRSMTRLAFIKKYLNKNEESEELFRGALKTCDILKEQYHQIYEKEIADCCFELGHIKMQQKDNHEAKNLFERSLQITKRLKNSGENNKEDLYAMNLFTLFLMHFSEKEYQSAYHYGSELLVILQSLYLDNADKWKYNFLSQLVQQSVLANYLGKFKEGYQHSRQALQEDSTFQVSYANIAVSLLMQGKTAEAEQLYRQYKNDYRKVFMEHITELEQLGIIPEERKKDVERIKAMLNEE